MYSNQQIEQLDQEFLERNRELSRKFDKKQTLKLKLEHCDRTTKLAGIGNVSEMLSFIDSLPAAFRYDTKVLLEDNNHRSMISYKTVKKQIMRGHLDLESWVYVNPKQRVPYRTPLGKYRDNWINLYEDSNFVIDLDKFKYGSSLEELIKYMVDRDFPLPAMITHTSPKSYHLAYFVNKKNLSKEELTSFGLKLVGATHQDLITLSQTQFEDKFGLDLNYLNQDLNSHKIRIPGSVNTNHIDENGQAWGCKSWINPNVSFIDLNVESPKFEPKISIKRKLNKHLQKQFIEFLTGKISKGLAAKVSKYFAYNSGHLTASNFGISQVSMAAELKMTQPSVSRLLKKLILMGFLKVTNGNYNFNPKKGKVVCREYGMGLVLKDFIDNCESNTIDMVKKSVEKATDILKNEYEPGQRNLMQMKDVRVLRYLNVPLVQKIEFLKEKNKNYAMAFKKKTASEKDIEAIIDNFERKAESDFVVNLAVAIEPDIKLLYKSLGLTHAGDI